MKSQSGWFTEMVITIPKLRIRRYGWSVTE
jgi:hypothetical protein